MGLFVELRPEERRSTWSAFTTLLGITGAHTLLETARDAMFLARLPASRLPWVYLAIAALGLILSRRKKRKTGAPARMSTLLLAAAAITLAFWFATLAIRATWLLYALYLWTGVFASWVVVEFWLTLGASFTVVQAKRLYGFIGAGSVLGAVSGAGLARGLAAVLPAAHLLVGASALLTATALGPALFIRRPRAAAQPARRRPAPRPANEGDAAVVLRDPFSRRVLLIVLVSTVALTTVDYLFKAAVARRVAPADLGRFFATASVAFNGVALIVQVGAVAVLLRRLGVHRALWVMPLLIGLGSSAVVAGGGLAAALVLKGADGALRHSLHRTSVELLFVPVADSVRARAKPFVDLVGQRGGQALASLVILGVVSLGVGERGLAAMVVALSALWIAVAAGIRQHYLELFRRTLREGRIDFDGALPELDVGALEALFAGLSSQRDAEVVGALELLAAQQRGRLIPAVMLYHPSKPVVLRALDLFAEQGRSDFVPTADRLVASAEPEIRAAALRARAAVAPDRALLRGCLADACPEVRATALVALLRRGWLAPEEGERALRELAGDASPAVQVALARAVGQDPSPQFEDTLLALAESADSDVQVETAIAMGRVGSERFLPALLSVLVHREQGAAAREAFVAMGEPALAFLDRALSDPHTPRAIRWNLPRAVGAFSPELAGPVLMRHLTTAREGVVRFRVLRALCRLRAAEARLELDAAVLRRAVEDTLRSAFRLIVYRVLLERTAAEDPGCATPAHKLIVTLLRDKEQHAKERIVLLLGLMNPEENFERIQRGLSSTDARTRASSCELVENVVEPSLRAPVLALIDDSDDATRLARAGEAHRPEGLKSDYDGVLLWMVERGAEMGALAAYHAAERGVRVAPIRASVPPDATALGADLAQAVE